MPATNAKAIDLATAFGAVLAHGVDPCRGALAAIRHRALELNLTMKDLDVLAKSRCYFQNCGRGRPHINGLYVYRAIEALGGRVATIWR